MRSCQPLFLCVGQQRVEHICRDRALLLNCFSQRGHGVVVDFTTLPHLYTLGVGMGKT